MFTPQTLDIKNFITITNSGIKIATFSQIKASLISRYKEIYGSDIDISDTNADGIFINDLALIINNILQSCQTAFANLDINTASGIYLDRLCALTNLRRKPATKSTANLIITNLDTENPVEIENGLQFIDRAGITWTYSNPSFIIPASLDSENPETASIGVECDEFGEISAPANWIYSPIVVMPIEISQPEKAQLGENEESDQDFRARQAASNGNRGITILDGLVNDLLSISGIKDVWIYNNDSDSIAYTADVAFDLVNVPAHSIYIILRKNSQSSTIDEDKVASTIYNDLTPGINTTDATGCDFGTAKSKTIISELSSNISLFNTDVFWKEASGQAYPITIVIKTLNNFNSNEVVSDETTGYVAPVEEELLKYLNNLPLNIDLYASDILAEATYADPTFKGKATYVVQSVKLGINANLDEVGKHGNYYYYTKMNATNNNNGTWTLTFNQ